MIKRQLKSLRPSKAALKKANQAHGTMAGIPYEYSRTAVRHHLVRTWLEENRTDENLRDAKQGDDEEFHCVELEEKLEWLAFRIEDNFLRECGDDKEKLLFANIVLDYPVLVGKFIAWYKLKSESEKKGVVGVVRNWLLDSYGETYAVFAGEFGWAPSDKEIAQQIEEDTGKSVTQAAVKLAKHELRKIRAEIRVVDGGYLINGPPHYLEETIHGQFGS